MGSVELASDATVAAQIAQDAADALAALRHESIGEDPWWFAERADQFAHKLIVTRLRAERPDDAVLSEEGVDDLDRLNHERVWIVDPLDGSTPYSFGGDDWAVHVALSIGGTAGPSAVAVPGLGACFATDPPVVAVDETRPERHGDGPVVVVGRSRMSLDGTRLAADLDATVVTCSSAGVKAMLAATGQVDAYVHASPLYEWDVCAPAAVAQAAGLTVVDRFGSPLVFNKGRPVVEGIIVAPAALVDDLVAAVGS